MQEIIYPSKVSIEQTSSENSSKSTIVSDTLIDLGRLWVDDYYFSKG
jgi:hypothetical protein